LGVQPDQDVLGARSDGEQAAVLEGSPDAAGRDSVWGQAWNLGVGGTGCGVPARLPAIG